MIDARKKMASTAAEHDAALAALHTLRGPVDPVDLIKKVTMLHLGVVQRDSTTAELTAEHAAIQAKARKADAELKKAGSPGLDAEHDLRKELKTALVRLERAKAIEAAQATYDDAVVALAEIRAEHYAASAAVHPVRARHADAIVAWSRHTRKLTQLDLARAAAERTNAERLAAAKASPPSTDPRDLPIAKAFAAKKEVARSTRRAYQPAASVRGSIVR
ncbi:hypothetical protein HU230_0036780 [Bradyrhizobium quebecense]|uniref:Uncharacterized protein n=1 Tax=Bradyrhizobium quebecense TaxID=2748629 RepID=A0A973WU05_9BRAD|nr:hypothetical protein [Bradyrhizobium quebecense]UGA43745.1 hypothetical protein HU230_0036780 [Bradyrhizobium quebecense]